MKPKDKIKDIVERIIIDAIQNVSVRRNGVDTWDNEAYDESVTFWTRKINKTLTQQRTELLEEILELECLKEEFVDRTSDITQVGNDYFDNNFLDNNNQLRTEIKEEIKKL